MSRPAAASGGLLWLRWSARDLRAHWMAVIAIALVMAIGLGVYAGLGSTSHWRRAANDESFAALHMHDLRVVLSPGTFATAGEMDAAVTGIDDAGSVSATAERLVVDNQLEAASKAESILVAARLVGMDIGADDAVDALWVRDGAVPVSLDGAPVAVLEAKFADARSLPARGTVTLAGSHSVAYGGVGVIPDDLYYKGPEGSVLSQGELAPVYLPLADAQAITGRPDQVNDLVLTVTDGADRDEVADQLVAAMGGRGLSATVTTRDEAVAVRVLYDDIETDQRFWNALAGLVLVAAGLAAFNLISRIVEAQRREIGIGMALGVPVAKLTIRPLLVGLEVAILGVAAGVGVGLLVGSAMGDLLQSFLPMPHFRTPFQPGVFIRAAGIGLLVPIVASVLPVWRAVRVEPIQAIRTGHLTARSSRLTDWTARVRLPGSTLTHMPVRNVVRSPRRALLTAAGVGAAISALVAVLGMLDSFGQTIDRVGDELTKGDPDRVLVQLDTFYPQDSPVLRSIDEVAGGGTHAGLRLPVSALGPGGAEDLDLLLELIDLDEAGWQPTLEGERTAGGGIVLARKAADDLGVALGDVIRVRHPVRTGSDAFALVESEIPVTAFHASPVRTFAFMDLGQAERFGLEDQANLVQAYPATGGDGAALQQAVFGLPGVSSSQAVERISQGFDEALDQFVGFLFITAAAVLALALLIAFNATSISVDERRREHATMRAFGLPVRSIVGVMVKESILLGLVATVLGIAVGSIMLEWMLRSLATTTLPDLGIERHLSATTMVVALLVGTVAVASAPLLLVRRLRRMDISDSLRVME